MYTLVTEYCQNLNTNTLSDETGFKRIVSSCVSYAKICFLSKLASSTSPNQTVLWYVKKWICLLVVFKLRKVIVYCRKIIENLPTVSSCHKCSVVRTVRLCIFVFEHGLSRVCTVHSGQPRYGCMLPCVCVYVCLLACLSTVCLYGFLTAPCLHSYVHDGMLAWPGHEREHGALVKAGQK